MFKTLLLLLVAFMVLGMAQPNYQERAIFLSESDNMCALSDDYQD